MERMKETLKKPLTFALVLCMLVTMIPGIGIGTMVSYGDGTYDRSDIISGSITVDSDESWGAVTISDGTTVTVSEGVTITMNGNVDIGKNVTIDGGAFKRMVGNIRIMIKDTGVTFKDVIIDGNGRNITASSPIMAFYYDKAGIEVTLSGNTIIKDSKISGTDKPSAVYVNSVNGRLILKDNASIFGNQGGNGAVLLNETNATLQVSDNVGVYDNTDSSGNNANVIITSTAGPGGDGERAIYVSSALGDEANIGVTPDGTPTASNFATCVSSEVASQSRDAFFLDNFENYGPKVSTADITAATKAKMQFSVTGNGVVSAKDSRGRDISIPASPGYFLLSEVPGKNITAYFTPNTENDFVKKVDLKYNENQLINNSGLTSLDPSRNKKGTFTVPAGMSTASTNTIGNVVFDSAITNIELTGILAPIAFKKAGDSLAGADISSITPGTATATISSLQWLTDAGNTILSSDTVFAFNKSYGLKVTLDATEGSKFAASPTVKCFGENMTIVSPDENRLVVQISKQSAKQDINEAISEGTVLVSVSAADIEYDGAPHGVSVEVIDKNGGTALIQNGTVLGSYTAVPATTEALGAGGKKTAATGTVTGQNAGTYTVHIKVTDDNYDGSYTTTRAFTISPATLTVAGIDVSDLQSRPYNKLATLRPADGQPKVIFSGLKGSDELTFDTDYSADWTYTYATAGTKGIIASSIRLLSTTLTGNYTLSGVTTLTLPDSGRELITKATPGPQSDSIQWTPPAAAGTKISEISFRLNKPFMNMFDQSIKDVAGALTLTQKLDGTTVTSDTAIRKNEKFIWQFVPTDSTNYETTTGVSVLWPAEPISDITFAGINMPTPGAVNNISSLTAICGPTEGSRIIINSASWKEVNPNTEAERTLTGGETFGYNRTYKLTIDIKPEGDDILTTGAINARLAGQGMTCESGNTDLHAVLTYEVRTPYGLLDDLCMTVNPITEYTYNGSLNPITFSAILPDGYVFQTALDNGTYGKDNVQLGYTDVSRNSSNEVIARTAYVKVRHPDYRKADGAEWLVKNCSIKINPKEIVPEIYSIDEKVYDGNTNAKATYSSGDIIASDKGKVTISGSAVFSDANVTTSSIRISATDFSISGERAFNYSINNSFPLSEACTPKITKATPTGGSITYTAIESLGTSFTTLGVHVGSPFVNNVNQALTVPGHFECYYDSTKATLMVGTLPVEKFHEYFWEFVPDDTNNYNTVTGTEVFWPGAPIGTVTISGIAAPLKLEVPTAKSAVGLETPEVSMVTVGSIGWYEEDSEVTSGSALPLGQAFRYNRLYTVTVVLDATAPEEFTEDMTASIDLGGGNFGPCTCEVSDDKHKATITYTFEGKTEKGILTDANLDSDWFNTYDAVGNWKSELKADTAQSPHTFKYVYSGRTIKPDPRTVGLQNTCAAFMYSVGGGVKQSEIPAYVNHLEPGVNITIYMTHPDYVGEVNKTVNVTILPCSVRPEGIDYSGKAYDGTTSITGAKLIWMPTDPGYELSGSAIDESLIDYSAHFEFDNPNCEPSKLVKVTDITMLDSSSDNFAPAYYVTELVNILSPSNNIIVSCGALITPAKVTPKSGTILNKPVPKDTKLADLYGTYITTNCSISTGSIMINENNRSLTVYGQLSLIKADGTAYTDEEFATTIVAEGSTYYWKFIPSDITNYMTTTGSQILCPRSPAPAGGGGGGGGAAVEEPPTAEGVVVTSGAVGIDQQIHIYIAKDGKIITNEYFYAEAEGGAVAAALEKVPNANVLIDSDGNVVVKGIIENGKLQTYLKGDNYLTVAYRSTDYVDVKGRWFEKHVDFCSARDIVNGVGEGRFDPDGTLTRGMAATILYRLEETPEITSSARWFADVEKDKWYSDGIAWAGGEGILNGVGTKNFAPHWAITREQMAVMIYNYCQKVQGSAPVEPGSLDMSLYYDSGDISYWAKDAVAFCYKTGLMAGDEDGNFCPRLSTTRAEFATIMERLVRGILNQTI